MPPSWKCLVSAMAATQRCDDNQGGSKVSRHRALVLWTLGITWALPCAAAKITEFTIPTSATNPAGIAVGPDGRIWFCEAYGNKVGAITTGGAITEYSIPTANAGLQSITS